MCLYPMKQSRLPLLPAHGTGRPRSVAAAPMERDWPSCGMRSPTPARTRRSASLPVEGATEGRASARPSRKYRKSEAASREGPASSGPCPQSTSGTFREHPVRAAATKRGPPLERATGGRASARPSRKYRKSAAISREGPASSGPCPQGTSGTCREHPVRAAATKRGPPLKRATGGRASARPSRKCRKSAAISREGPASSWPSPQGTSGTCREHPVRAAATKRGPPLERATGSRASARPSRKYRKSEAASREGPASSGPSPQGTSWTCREHPVRVAATKRGPPLESARVAGQDIQQLFVRFPTARSRGSATLPRGILRREGRASARPPARSARPTNKPTEGVRSVAAGGGRG